MQKGHACQQRSCRAKLSPGLADTKRMNPNPDHPSSPLGQFPPVLTDILSGAGFSGRLWTTQELNSLAEQAPLPNHPDLWPLLAFTQIKGIASRPDFPCYFAAKAFDSGGQRFLFCDTPDSPATLDNLATNLSEYLRIVERTSGWEALATIMFVVFKPLNPIASLEEYHNQGWRILDYLHRHDPQPWPADIPRDIEDPDWTFCYNGVSLFINMSCPAHVNRKSRNVGDSFAFILQPRAGFDEVAGNNPKGNQVRRMIRARIGRYDTIGPSPALGSYGDGATLEWKQYALQDDNEPTKAQCPLKKLFPRRSK